MNSMFPVIASANSCTPIDGEKVQINSCIFIFTIALPIENIIYDVYFSAITLLKY